MMLRVVVAVIAMFVAGAAPAQGRFSEAVDLWLSGNDRDSLPRLAEQAADGNAKARLLLGRIEVMDKGPSPYRKSLSRDAYRGMFRSFSQDTGYLGRSWIAEEAADGNQLAELLMAARRAEPDLYLIRDLVEMGEAQASDHPTRIMALYGSDEHREILLSSTNLLEELRPYLEYLTGEPEPRGDGLAALRHMTGEQVDAADETALGMAGILALGYGYGDVSLDNPWRGAVEHWLLTAPATRPIAELCEAGCGVDDIGACAFAVMALSGGYYEVIRIDSPLESVIPQEQFLQSPRARLMTLRRVAMQRREADGALLASTAEISEMSACAADMIDKARAEYN